MALAAAPSSADATFTTVAVPVISGVGPSGVTGTAATIGWTTDQNADSQVEYGLTTAYGTTTTLNAALVTTPAVVLIPWATASSVVAPRSNASRIRLRMKTW